MSDVQFFDPDNCLLGLHSPGLQAVKPSFEVVEAPLPVASRDSSLGPSEDEEEWWASRGDERPRDQEKPPQRESDYVLVRQRVLAPLDVEKHDSSGPASRDKEENNNYYTNQTPNNVMDNCGSKMESKSLGPTPDLAPTKMLDVKPPPRPPSKTGPTEGESIAKSPTLARFTINQASGDPSDTLPAIQISIPGSSIAGSSEPRQTIPSLTTALSDAGTPFAAPSPHSGMSPPSLSSDPSFWRTGTREGSTFTPSNSVNVSAVGCISTPASSVIHQSPAAVYSNPGATSPEQKAIDGSAKQVLSTESDLYEMKEIGGPFPNSIHKCSHPDCTAAPFQTRYLLNSHMNVHSDRRPYYCPIEGCDRGLEGRGFKRKNEMIRYVSFQPIAWCPTLTVPDTILFIPHQATCVPSALTNSTNIRDQTTSNVMCESTILTKVQTIPSCEISLRDGLKVVAADGGED